MRKTNHASYKKLVSLSLFVCVFFMSCEYGLGQFFWRENGVDVRSTKVQEIDSPPTIAGSEEYECIIITDVHFGAKGKNRKADFLSWVDSKDSKPFFCFVLGDVAEHGEESEYKEYYDLQQELKDRGISVYGIVGNHDVNNSGYAQWEKYVEPKIPSYFFTTDSFSWYFIDSANGTLGNEQLNDFLSHLENDNRLKLVFSHYSVYQDDIFYFGLSNTTERAKLLSAFEKNNVQFVFSGHHHPGGVSKCGSFTEYCVKGFHDYGEGVILHVDESRKTLSVENFSF